MAPLYQYLDILWIIFSWLLIALQIKVVKVTLFVGMVRASTSPENYRLYGIWTTNRKDHHHAVTAIANTVNFSDGHVIGNLVGDIELCRGGLHGDWWPGERCWGNDEDIADRHTTSRGGGVTVPVQNNKGGAELVLSGGYSWRGWITYACHLCNKV